MAFGASPDRERKRNFAEVARIAAGSANLTPILLTVAYFTSKRDKNTTYFCC
ncbi:MAG: hypothetical protein LAO19_12570 [Acidobacteriia bacterium]|nr:hypothetical protein [Terriglobia bacterium]